MEVNQILEDVFKGKDFPEYDKVRLSYEELNRIIKSGKRDWISAIENYNSKVDDHIIFERECWWKEVLKSRIF